MATGLRLSSHRPQWEEFSDLLERLEVSGPASLTPPEKRRLVQLFRLVESDLAVARQQGQNPQMTRMLNRLLARAYPFVQPSEPADAGGPYTWMADFATALRNNLTWIGIAALVLFGSAAIAVLHYKFAPDLTGGLFSAELIGHYENLLAQARESQVQSGPELELAAQIPEEARWRASQMIMWNNIRVTFIAFATGAVVGWLGYLVLIQNGYMLGALAAVYFNYGYGAYFTAGVAPHGVVELSCICLGSGAGIALGHAWLFPGARSRGEAFRRKGRKILPLLIGAAVILVPTGFIEGFVTPVNLPEVELQTLFWLKTAFGVAWFLVVAGLTWYFGWGTGRFYGSEVRKVMPGE